MIHIDLPINSYRPEEMRVREVQETDGLQRIFYPVESRRSVSSYQDWITLKEWLNLANTISDAINWYLPEACRHPYQLVQPIKPENYLQ